MRVKKIKLYQFEELNKKAQKKAIEEVRKKNNFDDFVFDKDLFFEEFSIKLKDIGIECEDFYWDTYPRYLAMSKARITDINKFLRAAGYGKHLIMMSLFLEDKDCELQILIQEHLREFNTVYVDYCGKDYKLLEEIFPEGIEDLEGKLTEYLKEVLSSFLKQIEDYYDYLNSDEYLEEIIKDEGYEFTKEGRLFIDRF